MCRRLAAAALSLAAVLTTTGAAVAASAPKAGSDYYSSKPNVSITVGKPANSVTVYVSCFPSPGVGDSWSSGKLPLKHGAFKYDRTAKINTENGASFGTSTGTVLVTGTFKAGKFIGAMQIAGASCAEANYVARFNKGGGGGAGV